MEDKDYYRLYEDAFAEVCSDVTVDSAYKARFIFGKKNTKKACKSGTVLITKFMRKEREEEEVTLCLCREESRETLYRTISAMGRIVENRDEAGAFHISAIIKSRICDNMAVLNAVYVNGSAEKSTIRVSAYSKEVLSTVHTAQEVLGEFRNKLNMQRG